MLGDMASAQLLLGAGASPELRDPNGRTAKDFAAKRRDARMLGLLESATSRRPRP
jgi:ankyrin repeat protein